LPGGKSVSSPGDVVGGVDGGVLVGGVLVGGVSPFAGGVSLFAGGVLAFDGGVCVPGVYGCAGPVNIGS
jgi:hypothetical protein